ncbi:hypothetical protein KCU95_g5379, partial [Aureobasidium melanogenum]
MTTLPNEIVAMIAQLVAPKSIGNFRQASKTFNELSRKPFINKAFEHIKTSANMVALDLLFFAVSHRQYGPTIKTITICMNGIDDKPSELKKRLTAIFRALRQRGQQVTITIIVTAIEIYDNNDIAEHLTQVIGHLTRLDLRHRLSTVPLTLTISSSALLKGIFQELPRFLCAFRHYCTERSFVLNYADEQASVDYDVLTQTVIVSGLKNYQLHQVTKIFDWLSIKHATITDCEGNHDTKISIDRLLRGHRSRLNSVEIKDVTGRHLDINLYRGCAGHRSD